MLKEKFEGSAMSNQIFVVMPKFLGMSQYTRCIPISLRGRYLSQVLDSNRIYRDYTRLRRRLLCAAHEVYLMHDVSLMNVHRIIETDIRLSIGRRRIACKYAIRAIFATLF